ncbi:MAG: methylenetetrahydrofolate reductase C-terminal domain-containing protein [Dehalococcoidia bacterium]|nr:methylenetetrahydrofolate reductase C-terminal domain-containing protein [Dehalococcoidia bacterium]MCK5653737.1 methylenetetrahydrofolate reductase C-terminal domain-containing protein [Dehalococcoidia bacterium]
MIVTTLKPLDEILNFISPFKNILIVGCDGCTQPPRGVREAEALSQLLELGGKQRNKEFAFKVNTLVKQCDSYLTAVALKDMIDDDVEAVLSLACGLGPQTIAGLYPSLPVLPAQNTVFMGAEEREAGTLEERCAACGDCLLALTGGICPVARCAKSLLNGPCGGSQNGKCEIDPEKDCAWALIIERLEKLGRLQDLETIQPPKNYQVVTRPGKIMP